LLLPIVCPSLLLETPCELKQNDDAYLIFSNSDRGRSIVLALGQGLVLSTKILRSEKFSEKVRKFKTYHFCPKGKKNYLADVLA
jgi:hypothetical protein